jgi:Uma2 family endonuclease
MSSVPTAVKARMTADEFWEFVNRPENEPRQFDLIRGEVVEMSRPTKLHGIVQLAIGAMLREWAGRVGRGYVAVESGVVLDQDPDTVVGPDVAYYTDADRFEDVPPKWGDVPPELAVEILSPNDKMSKVNAKIREYLLSGTKQVWLVDYEERKVWVYRPNQVHDAVAGDDVLNGGDDFPGLSIRLADLFRFPKALTQPPAA